MALTALPPIFGVHMPKGLSVVTIPCKPPRCRQGGQASRTVVFLSEEAYQNGRGAAVSMCILRFYVPVDLFVPLCGNDPAVVKVSGDTIIIDPDATTEDGDSSQIPNPLTVHNSLAGLAKAVGFDVKAPTVPAEQGISETEVAAVVSSAL